MARMAKVDTKFGPIGITQSGGGERIPIIFLHGVGSDKSVWQAQLHHFGQSRHAIAVDYPGYGESELIPDATRDDFARAVLAAMDSLDIPLAHICGLSLGGVVALAMHSLAPERCASLVIADSFAVHPEGPAIHQRSVDAADTIGMAALAKARASSLLGSAATDAMRAEVIDTMSRIDPAAYKIGARAVWLADQVDRARSVDCPTLILCGSQDTITPPALSAQLQPLIAGSRYRMIDASGHLANLEQPAAFNDMVEQFLFETEAKS